jgi:para-nitrobenzyl esterase
LAEDPAAVFASGRQHRVSLLIGSNSREQLGAIPTDLGKAIDQKYGELASRAAVLYGAAGIESLESDIVYGTPSQQWVTDTTLRCGAVAQAMWHRAAGISTYEYEFARVPVGRESVGATHASELAYVFGTLDKAGIRGAGPTAQVDGVDRQVSADMQQYWSNFARTGNPNGNHLPAWPQFNALSRGYLQFAAAPPAAKKGLRRPFCDLFIENLQRQILH